MKLKNYLDADQLNKINAGEMVEVGEPRLGNITVCISVAKSPNEVGTVLQSRI
jgi:hypothetical protein